MQKHLLFIFIFSMFSVVAWCQDSENPPKETTSVGNQISDPTTQVLSEAYPNPANVETKINYNLPKNTLEAKIIIRSLLGHVMSEHLIEGSKGTITIPTSELTGGMYFYSLMIDGEIYITRKLIIRH